MLAFHEGVKFPRIIPTIPMMAGIFRSNPQDHYDLRAPLMEDAILDPAKGAIP